VYEECVAILGKVFETLISCVVLAVTAVTVLIITGIAVVAGLIEWRRRKHERS
jgi:hypothetical protein